MNANSDMQWRPAQEVMQLDRLGSFHASRLSFMRTLLRRVMNEQWQITPSVFDLDSNGYGSVVYRIQAAHGVYSFVVFSNYLEPDNRNDRVIAEQWDLTMTLCEGEVSEEYLAVLRENVPKQEAGRMDSKALVLSRANRSARNFDYVVDCLAKGEQPDVDKLVKVGYLYRTTAVYGSGKFGLADWQKVLTSLPDFAAPFAAEMFTCYMLREFSVVQAQHIATARAPDAAVDLNDELRRYLGIGNSTGLGMAPYLIHHPLLIAKWIETRETALAAILSVPDEVVEKLNQLIGLLKQSDQHFKEVFVDDEWQASKNKTLSVDLKTLLNFLSDQGPRFRNWSDLLEVVDDQVGLDAQELLRALLLELYPDIVDPLADDMTVFEDYRLDSSMPVKHAIALIEQHYQWALNTDFEQTDERYLFWYRSEEKSEPRLGVRGEDDGEELQMPLGIALAVQQVHQNLLNWHEITVASEKERVLAEFLLDKPEYRSVLRRVLTLCGQRYGDIHANILNKDLMPVHLLRCKLAFFGVSKFDPRSRLWLRNTMYQGAPLLKEIGKPYADDWYFPVAPSAAG
ncbi:MAG: hypothetical protein AAF542_03425 [Pseudomonadota bacterium]